MFSRTRALTKRVGVRHSESRHSGLLWGIVLHIVFWYLAKIGLLHHSHLLSVEVFLRSSHVGLNKKIRGMVNDICDKIGYNSACIGNIAEMLAPVRWQILNTPLA